MLAGAGVWNIEVFELETGARTVVTRETSPEVITRYPYWSPRGDLLAFDRMEVRGTL